jgi:hypothetical protein
MLWNNPIIDERISTFKTDELQLLLEATYQDLKDSTSIRVMWNIKISCGFSDEEDLKTTCEILNICRRRGIFWNLKLNYGFFGNCPIIASKRTEKALNVSNQTKQST